ncbi:MAG TPA: hypothetical protein VMU22_08020 [Rhizomicrobium sp.]|nr:hypothetical protein [Rhizomicrobium sp.]
MSKVGKVFAVAVVTAACVVAVAYVGYDVMVRAMKMAPAQTTASQYAAAAAGTPLKVVVRIDKKDGPDLVAGHLMTSISETEYRATPQTVRARIEPAVRFIMGSMSDLKRGEIAQFDGTRDSEGVLHVRRIVVLSSYVHEVAS